MYLFMLATTPTPEQTYNVSQKAQFAFAPVLSLMDFYTPQAMSPDLRRKVDANRAARLAREAAMQQQTDAQVSLKAS